TGPVVRGDVNTVRDHLAQLDALAAREAPQVDVPPAYRTLARVTAQRALLDGRITEPVAQELLDVLVTPDADVAGPDAAGPGAAEVAGPLLVRTRADLATALRERPGRRAVVMTMGALHEGHLDLVREARVRGDVV